MPDDSILTVAGSRYCNVSLTGVVDTDHTHIQRGDGEGERHFGVRDVEYLLLGSRPVLLRRRLL